MLQKTQKVIEIFILILKGLLKFKRMKKNILKLSVVAFFISNAFILQAQNKKSGYEFTPIKQIETTSVKDQGSSGTCWSYATTSFLETELIRLGKGKHDLSEMYFVRLVYPQKAEKYIRYHGLANFGQGGQAHDVTNQIEKYGFVPEAAYTGLNYGTDYHQHGELEKNLKSTLDNSLANKKTYTGKNFYIFNSILDTYLGKLPKKFEYKGKEYTPPSFAKEMGINPNDYIELTSYTNYPFYKKVELEIPDNWSHDYYYNLPIDELMEVINNAFDKGYSVNWDGDVSSPGFSHSNGVAIVPEDNPKNMEGNERLKWEKLSRREKKQLLFNFDAPKKEKKITQEYRQKTFDNFQTTDDHLMHLVGKAKDQTGTIYYITKNSWAENSNKFGGYLYMSESYIRLNTTAIQVHIDVLPKKIKEKLGL